MLHSSATQWQHRFSLEINFTEGYVELQGILSGSKSYGEEKLVIGKRQNLSTGADREETITYLEDNSWRDEINEFADSIVNNSPVLAGTVDDALSTMKLVYRIYGADRQWAEKFDINTSFHYMITGTDNFIGIEFNKTITNGEFFMVGRPQMRVSITDSFLIGILTGIPISKEEERLSFFLRMIYEPD